MKITLIPITELKPYGKNAKKHPKSQIEAIARSIKEFGFNQPVVVDKNNSVIVGHTTQEFPAEPATGVYPGYYGGVTYTGDVSEKAAAANAADTHTDIETTTRMAVIKYLDRK